MSNEKQNATSTIQIIHWVVMLLIAVAYFTLNQNPDKVNSKVIVAGIYEDTPIIGVECIKEGMRPKPNAHSTKWIRVSLKELSNSGESGVLWGVSEKDLWVSWGGELFHFDGSKWVKESLPGSFNAVWGSRSSDIWAVGNEGIIAHYDGKAWSKIPAPTEESLFSIYGLSSNDIWAGGNNGTLIHYDGNHWQSVKNLPPLSYEGGKQALTELVGPIWSSNSGDVWALAGLLGVLRYDGNQWVLKEFGCTGMSAYTVSGSGKHPFFVGLGKVVSLKENKFLIQVDYKDEKVGEISSLENIAISEKNEIWVTGYRIGDRKKTGTLRSFLVHYNGKEWMEERGPDPTCLFESIQLVAGKYFYLLGSIVDKGDKNRNGKACMFMREAL